MSVIDFICDSAKTTLVVAGTIAALPILGPVGTITATGAALSLAIGTTASAIDHAKEE